MSPIFDAEKQQLLHRLSDHIHAHHNDNDSNAIAELANDYFLEHSSEALAGQELERLYTAVLDCWRLIQRNRSQLGPSFNWEKQLRELGGRTARRYQMAFCSAYRDHFTPEQALQDIALLDSLDGRVDQVSRFDSLAETHDALLHFKLLSRRNTLVLSDVVRILEKLGVRVIGMHPYRVHRADGRSFWIHDFTLCTTVKSTETEKVKPLFRDAFDATWRGEVENDDFNRLVMEAGLAWREVALLRAYARYCRQTRFNFSQPFIAEALCSQAAISRHLVALFHERFSPRRRADGKAEAEITAAILDALEQVENLDEDRILRRYLELISATLRTNFYQLDQAGQPKGYFSFKFDPGAISDLPLPRPKYEIFVYSPQVEGVHLRAGKVSRGGLRWSDRAEDYRTEVLGLVKAQQVKNAVIVPMGAKGCFIAKKLPTGETREQIQAEGIACYQTYIRGLLDITDNLVAGQVVPPPAVVRHDDDDPYLVVAADKGTATFSDIANAIAEEYGFWLGDAFASGGSQGYDHKRMGITARGAWESVKRHFREQQLDIQSSPFTVVGIGDMAGDVFGNGMLLSEHIRLLAAFNHQHIFIDPNPDCALAHAERQRLFALPRSTWSDYDATLISKGGGVFSRRSKRIAISPDMRACLDIDAEHLTPDQLINALLKAPVDMLWNGGIGTYVKASSETHADVGDKANDGLRINGNELRCRVLGEGGNLGFTQRGRIEFALNGGASNTDFIDNAGGVDCSDHEVNIKILLNEQMAQGHLSLDERNRLLQAMTEQVAQRVLANNYRQVQALSMVERHAAGALDEYVHLIDSLAASGRLDPALEFLPERKTLLERQAQGLGLTRPELALLISYTKIELKQALIGSTLPDDAFLAREVETAFPFQLVERFPEAVRNHPLYREIAATRVANDLVNRMGVTFLHSLRQATGADLDQIAAAYLIAREVYDIDSRWRAIEALDNQVDARIQISMMKELAGLLTRACWWLLRRRRHELHIGPCIEEYRTGIRQAQGSMAQLQRIIPSPERWQTRYQRYTEAGVPALLAAQVAASKGLYWLLDIIEAARELGRDLQTVSEVYFRLGERLNLPWLDRQIRTFQAGSHWQSLARNSYRNDLDAQQRALTIRALRDRPVTESAASAIDDWTAAHAPFLHRWQGLQDEMQRGSQVDCALFTVAINVLSELG